MMKTLFVAYLDRSLDFYTSIGYVEVGSDAIGDGVRIAQIMETGEGHIWVMGVTVELRRRLSS